MTNKSNSKLRMFNKWQKFIHSDVRHSVTKKILAAIASILVAFVIALVIACSVCGTWDRFADVLKTIFASGFSDGNTLNTLFSNMGILIVGGMAFIFAYKAGLFNIGISGQMVAGATVATIICHLAGLQPGLNQFVILVASMATGALVSGIIGGLKAFLKINEVVSSIMFNWILYFMSIMTLGMLPIPTDASSLNTNAPADSLLFRWNGNSWLPLLIIAGVIVIFVFIILNYTVFGKKQKVTGLSNTGALAAGYNVKANMITSMAISGAIAGALGIMVYCGFNPNMPVTAAAKTIPQEGFNGISVGLISMCNPIATLTVSFFFSMVKTSASDLQLLGIDNHIADVVFGIVVYGAAAISLFLNMKPYWLTLNIFKGKNYSKIQHERNMSNIELISMSSDQCAILRKYFVYYQKQVNARSSMDLKKSIRFKMWIADLRYKSALRKAKRRVKKNKTKDLLTGERFYKQEMIHLLFDKKLQCYVIAAPGVKSHIKYIKVNSEILANPGFKTNLESALKCKVSEDLITKIKAESNKLEANPFNDSKIRLVAYISYLQTLRSGLKYRIDVTKENKLAFFELQQTKKQCESIGLGEIRSKEQYEFAHEAYYKAFWKTYSIVNAHYDMMVKTFTRGKPLNMIGIRFDPATMAQLYINNLKKEIAEISYLTNCLLDKQQLQQVSSLVSKVQYLSAKVDAGSNQARGYRKAALPYYNKHRIETDKAKKLHLQLKANTKMLNKLTENPTGDFEAKEINRIIQNVESLSYEIAATKQRANDAYKVADDFVTRAKDVAEDVVTNTVARDQAKRKIASIVGKARQTEKVVQRDKWAIQRQINEEAEKELRKIELKKQKKLARKGGK